MAQSEHLWILKMIIDLLSLFLVFLPWIILKFMTPYRRGFYCNDDSIKYPLREGTVSSNIMNPVGLILVAIIILVVEGVRFHIAKKSTNPPTPFRINAKYSIPEYVITVYKYYGIYLFGLAAQQTITNIGKYTIGRLRPHFIDVCRPNYTAFNCTAPGIAVDDMFVYVTGDVCTGTDHKKMLDARLSFPSGHSSFSVYVAVFIMFYLQARFTWKGSRLLRHFFQAAFIYVAVFVCLSRISDYKHHWSDVLGGAIIGAFIASLTSLHISSQFKTHHRSVDDDIREQRLNSMASTAALRSGENR